MLISKKGLGPAMFIDMILSTIVFFIAAVFIIAFLSPNLQIRATADIQAVDSNLGCEITLANLLRAEDSNHIKYADYISNGYLSYLTSNKNFPKDFESFFKSMLDKVYAGENNWKLTAKRGLSSDMLFSLGSLNTDATGSITSCRTFVPLPAARLQKDCVLHAEADDLELYEQFEIITQKFKLNSELTDRINCGSDEGSCFGVDDVEDNTQKSVVADSAETGYRADTAAEDTDELDSLVIPLLISNERYSLTITETDEDYNIFSAILSKKEDLEDCSINLALSINTYYEKN